MFLVVTSFIAILTSNPKTVLLLIWIKFDLKMPNFLFKGNMMLVRLSALMVL